jgi:acetolactate synthase-1/2/3 large subunit
MGGSAGASLGAKLARPGSKVVNLIGDGGISAGLAAMATAVEQELPVLWIVLNNSSWDSIETYQHIAYDGRVFGTRLEDRTHQPWNPDFVKLAEAYGIPGAVVKDVEELPGAIEVALGSTSSYLLEVVVGPTKLNATGHWDVGDLLKREGDFKRERQARQRGPRAAGDGEAVSAQ